jgi:spermidine synthase
MLAQTLSTLMGDTITRYNVTIGLYIASLGLGSIIYPRFIKQHTSLNLARIELTLSFTGGLGPIVLLFFDYLLRNFIPSGYAPLSNIINHSYIILIGFLSGIELPFLINLAKQSLNFSIGRVLFLDYVGSFIAAIIFPIILMPYYSLFSISNVIALINSIVALYLSIKVKDRLHIFLSVLLILIFIIMLIFATPLANSIIQGLYL